MGTIEMTIAYHCAPALAGIKPSNLVSFCSYKYPNIEKQIEEWNTQLNISGIYFEQMCTCSRSVLVLVYRKKRIIELLENPEIRSELTKAGYPVSEGIEEVIHYLKKRLGQNDGFPHEVGLFLGYPLEDVQGFVQNGGKDYKLNGCWKVYSDAEKAAKLFQRYKKCRAAVCGRVDRGHSIVQMFTVA